MVKFLPKQNLQKKLDDCVEKILKLPDNLSVLARDFIQIRLTLNKGKAVVTATRAPKTSDLHLYGRYLRDELDSFSDGSNLRHKVSLIYSHDLIVCTIEFLHSVKAFDVSVEGTRDTDSPNLHSSAKKFSIVSANGYMFREVSVFLRNHVF